MSIRSEELWTTRWQAGNVRVTTTVVSVACSSAVVGWIVSERYGPLARRRWYLTGAAAEQAYHAAEDQAARYVEAFKNSEQERP